MASIVESKDLIINGGIFNQHNYLDRSADVAKLHEYNITTDAFHNSQKRSEEANFRNVNDIVNRWTTHLQHASANSNANSKDQSHSIFDALVVDDVIKDIFIWLHDHSTDCLVMWVYDEDRSLTSLIGQAVADILAKRKELSATYFFPCNFTASTDASHIVPTIAYQLAQNISDIEKFISHAFANQISIFNLKIQEQVSQLVVLPLTCASESLSELPPRASANVIVLHALEDCDNFDIQLTLLEEFLCGLVLIEADPFSQRILLMGRPTDRLRECISMCQRRIGRILQRPVHLQRWRAREEEIRRREEQIRRDEEEVWEKKEEVLQQQKATQRAWKIRSEAEKMEERLKEWEERLRKREEALCQRENQLSLREQQLTGNSLELDTRLQEAMPRKRQRAGFQSFSQRDTPAHKMPGNSFDSIG